ncbi:hypothetical protein GALL_532940 [mine drainage metagenome]|uniref:Uncharacterized protein n=1 Tax=mine drainage metagenome TaxID=410659 RepID=A0A1J5P3B0_9ZZZZ
MAYVLSKALLAVVLWGSVAVGYLRAPLSVPERILGFTAAALLVAAAPLTDEIGFALCAALLGRHAWRTGWRPSRAASI